MLINKGAINYFCFVEVEINIRKRKSHYNIRRSGRKLSFSKFIHGAVMDEICHNRLANMVNTNTAFLFPFAIESFINFRMVRPRWRLNSCFIECGELNYKLKNYLRDSLHYEIPVIDEYELQKEYCHGEPPSSYKDFLVLNEKNPIAHDTEMILEDRGELAYAVKAMRVVAKLI